MLSHQYPSDCTLAVGGRNEMNEDAGLRFGASGMRRSPQTTGEQFAYETVEDSDGQDANAWQMAMNYSLSLVANLKAKQQRRKRQRSRSPSATDSTSHEGIELSEHRHEDVHFDDLPTCLRWHLFTYLDSHSLCQAAMVSRSWYSMANDWLLWKRLMRCDVRRWNEVGHQTHPNIFTEAASDLPIKEIYLRCHPQASKFFAPSNGPSTWRRLQQHLPNWFKRPLRVAMFGPGLDSLPISMRLLFNSDAMFKPTGMTPGNGGVGSGVSIRHADQTINLMILYKATKAERTRSSDVEEINRLVYQATNAAASGDGDAAANQANQLPVAELTARVKDMCRTVDAFICVLDNRQPLKESVAPLIRGMMAAGNPTPREHCTPLLVMSATESREQACRSCAVDLASSLRLTLLTQPWKTQDVRLDSPATVFSALDWLIDQA